MIGVGEVLQDYLRYMSPTSLLSVHQDASGKMNVGDEIVTIGDTAVCTSTYQDICDLMHNLPITLTLEIKKPVSGKLHQKLFCMSAYLNVPKRGWFIET